MKFHLVLVSKCRRKIFTDTMLTFLEEKVQGLCAKWDVELHEFEAENDHVHLLISLNPSIQPSKFINNLKTVSSRYMKKEYGEHLRKFYCGTNAMWSRSYCLVSEGGAPSKSLLNTCVIRNA